MSGLFKFIGDVLKPIVTILVTLFVLATLLSIASPGIDGWIQSYIPAWGHMDSVIAQGREWLGIHQEADTPWWQFWD